MPGDDSEGAVGICLSCRHVRVVPARSGQRYYRCERAVTDADYAKYPRLPVRRCDGHEPGVEQVSDDPRRAARDRHRESEKAVGARANAR